jgi:outer membrane protein assembly factor BamE (lipoprotein component of BamABCDE complex)
MTPPKPVLESDRDLSRTLCLVLLLALTGCGWLEFKPQLRGNRIDPDVLKELVVGTSTKADATALLGSPTSRATFDDNRWIYISEITQPQIARTQVVLSQNVVVLNFDDKGVLRNVERLNQEDALPVTMVARATPSPGSEASLLQQLFGNVGRYNPGAAWTGGGPSNNTGNLNTR